MELLDLAALVESVVARRAHTVPPQIQLVVDVASNLAQVHGVRTELEQLVTSLIELWLSAVPGTQTVALVVDRSDDGDGIRLELLDGGTRTLARPFPPRLDKGDSLRVVLAVVGNHDATLRVTTSAAGATRLQIVFPIAHGRSRAARCRRPTSPLPRPGAPTIH